MRLRLVADPGRPAARDRPRAARRARAGDLEHRDRRGHRPARSRGIASPRSRTGGPTRPRCCCSSSGTAATTSTATTSRRARSRRCRSSPAASPAPASGRTARSGTGSSAASTPGVVFEVGRDEPVLAPPEARAARPALRAVGVPEPEGPARPRLARRAGRAEALADAAAHPRRPDLGRPRPLVARGPGLRRHGLLRRDAQLPRLDRLRRRVARRADRQHRLAGGRGHRRGPRRPARPGDRGPGTVRRSPAGRGAAT